MSDLFISYASEDRPRVKVLADGLQAHGWSVWWDRTIPAGKSYHRVIEEALTEARCVIVVWSQHSVNSNWVRAEADEGLKRNVLVPVSIDDSSAPLVFRQIQTADLSGWQGETSSPLFQKLATDIAACIGPPPAKTQESQKPRATDAPPPPTADTGKRRDPAPSPADSKSKLKWPAITAIAGVIALGALWLMLTSVPVQPPEILAPVQPPEILAYDVEPAELSSGQAAILSWDTSNAEKVTLNGAPVSSTGSTKVKPNETTAYTLIAKNKEGKTVKRDIEIRVGAVIPAPEILAFEAKPPSIQEGRSASLGWKTSNATEVEIRGLGTVSASGSKQVKPSKTTKYLLIARNKGGKSVQREIQVRVAAPLPKIISFKGAPLAIQKGQPSSLGWRTANAEKITLDGAPVSPSGSKQVNPKQTTTYELVATNRKGESDRQTFTIRVELPSPAPEILSYEAVTPTINAGQSATLRWRTENAKKVFLNETPVQLHGELKVNPKKTTAYTLVARNGEGRTDTKTLTVHVKEEIADKKMEPVPGEAVVYIVQNAFGDYSAGLTFDDGTQITTWPGTFYRWVTTPGTHTIESSEGMLNASIELQVEAGKTYYVEHSVTGMRGSTTDASLQKIDGETGREMMTTGKPCCN
ncbi:MAG: TIR domain-containing protein [Betaproteobacteria bacterium]|nr:TIR domain-containing protein [Betaproteobacteria bacterium]MDH3435922.1 TIR domain-containing protein [Betaproteobacteria bacterium]